MKASKTFSLWRACFQLTCRYRCGRSRVRFPGRSNRTQCRLRLAALLRFCGAVLPRAKSRRWAPPLVTRFGAIPWVQWRFDMKFNWEPIWPPVLSPATESNVIVILQMFVDQLLLSMRSIPAIPVLIVFCGCGKNEKLITGKPSRIIGYPARYRKAVPLTLGFAVVIRSLSSTKMSLIVHEGIFFFLFVSQCASV